MGMEVKVQEHTTHAGSIATQRLSLVGPLLLYCFKTRNLLPSAIGQAAFILKRHSTRTCTHSQGARGGVTSTTLQWQGAAGR